MKFVNAKRLNDNAVSPLPITNYALANLATLTTEAIDVSGNTGFAVLTLKENKVGAGGSVTVHAEYSDDNVNWNQVYTCDFSGTVTVEGNIAAAFQNITRRIVHTVRLARFMRYVIVAAADSQVTADFTFQEEESGF